MSSLVARQRTRERVRVAGATAALVAAGLYLLIGVRVLSIGTAASGETPDLFLFGAMAGATFAVIAALLFRFPSRVLWIGVAVLQLRVLVGYVAMADVRTPPIEPSGLLIKARQVIVLGCVVVLLVRGGAEAAR